VTAHITLHAWLENMHSMLTVYCMHCLQTLYGMNTAHSMHTVLCMHGFQTVHCMHTVHSMPTGQSMP